MTNINVIMQDEKVTQLEFEKEALLQFLRSIEEVAAKKGELDAQQVVTAIKQFRGQIESGVVFSKRIKPEMVRE